MLLSDGWDIWEVRGRRRAAVNLTGNGKKDGIRYAALLPRSRGEGRRPDQAAVLSRSTANGRRRAASAASTRASRA